MIIAISKAYKSLLLKGCSTIAGDDDITKVSEWKFKITFIS